MSTFASGERAIAELVRAHGQVPPAGRNEATTRLQMLDVLLFDCLGWERADCLAEERLEDTYTDYTLSAPHRLMIVEAKREATTFVVPQASRPSLHSPISFFGKYHKDVFAAISQCMRYCQERGTPFGVVSNGHQVIAFVAVRMDGVAPIDGNCLVFDSLQTVADHFLLFWNCLSRDGVQRHGLTRELLRLPSILPPEKLSSRLPRYPGFKNRNPLQADLQILGDLIIEDVIHTPETEEEFLRECYCSTNELTQYSLLSRFILEARYSELFEQSLEGPKLVGSEQLLLPSDQLPAAPAGTPQGATGLSYEALSASLSRRPILLIGDVGVGKTMFVRHLIQIDARDFFDRAIFIYVDLGSQPSVTRDLPAHVAYEIEHQLLERYAIDVAEREFVRTVYQEELRRFGRGIFGELRESSPAEFQRQELELLQTLLADREHHLQASLEYIHSARMKDAILFLDNVDQRPPEFQEEAFLIGNSIAATWPVAVFVSIRPETYHRSKLQGTLSAYHPKAFTVAPPRLDAVIAKRLAYAIRLAGTGKLRSLDSVTINVPSVKSYMEVLLQSFGRDYRVIEFCENMCGGNVRSALEFIRSFIGSGHVDTRKILTIQRERGEYRLPLHEFMRAVIYGDHEYYDPRSSVIMNLFDITEADQSEYFLACVLLGQLERLARTEMEGFVSEAELFAAGQELGFTPLQQEVALSRCWAHGLVEAHDRRRSYQESETQGRGGQGWWRITSVGAYYIRRLSQMFTYLDAVIVDLPIIDPRLRAELADAWELGDRLERAERIKRYLDECWLPLDGKGTAFDWKAASTAVARDIDFVRERVFGSGRPI